MKRTDFSVDWLFAACAPDTELLPWNAQFTPVDLPHDWQIRHADDLYRDGTLFYRKYFFVTDVPGTRRMLWFGGAYMDTTVFVNGTEVGQWKYGYTSFWFDPMAGARARKPRFTKPRTPSRCKTPHCGTWTRRTSTTSRQS